MNNSSLPTVESSSSLSNKCQFLSYWIPSNTIPHKRITDWKSRCSSAWQPHSTLELVDSPKGDCFLLPHSASNRGLSIFFYPTSSYKSILSLGLYSKKSLLSSALNLVFGFLFVYFGYDSHILFVSFLSEQFSISEH